MQSSLSSSLSVTASTTLTLTDSLATTNPHTLLPITRCTSYYDASQPD